MKFLDPLSQISLPATKSLPKSDHVFSPESIAAINAALAAGRPLLVRGEPGTGKSQLARAAAVGLNRVFLSKVIDSRTEARDLLFIFDAVARLADAQVMGALKKPAKDVKHELRETKYVDPGPIWWAFDWQSAEVQAKEAQTSVPEIPEGWQAGDGAVLLIDEIDKADSALPNGLLEALGSARFPRPGGGFVTCGKVDPLVLVTTNEERSLPDAFLRRCLVLQLAWPEDDAELITSLVTWGAAHFEGLDPEVLQEAAKMVAEDRRQMRKQRVNPPGGAEYLDLVRAVVRRHPRSTAAQKKLLNEIRNFVLRKHPDTDA